MRRVIATMATVLLAASAAACGGSSGSGGGSAAGGGGGSNGTTQLNVGVIPIADVAPIYLGKKKGFFKDEGLSLNLQQAQGGAAIVPGVVSGQYQIGFSNVTSLLIAESKGLPLKVVAAGNSSTGKAGHDFAAIVVPKGSSITSAKDLEGKTVAVNNLKNIGDTTVRAAVAKAGGNPDKVKFIELAFPDMPAALSNHRIDAAWVVEPFLTITEGQGAQPIAWNLVDTYPGLMIAAYFTSSKYEQQNPDVVKKFTTAMNKSLDYAQSHSDEVRQIITTYTKIDKATAQKITLPAYPSQINKKSTEKLAELAKKDGLVTQMPDVSKLLP